MELQNSEFEINEVLIEYDDFKEYSKSTNVNGIIKVWRYIGAGYIALFGIILLILLLFNEPDAAKPSSINQLSWELISKVSGFLVMAFVLFITPWFIYPHIADRLLKKAFNKNKFIKKPQNYSFNDVGFRVDSENGESRFNWEEVNAVKETKSYLALYISSYQAFIIPKKYLVNRKSFIDYLKSKTGNKYVIIKKGLQLP